MGLAFGEGVNYLLSPHDDDAALFAAIICQREQPEVVVVTDSYVQPARGEIGCSAAERAAESERAHCFLGCVTRRLGLHDDAVLLEQIEEALTPLRADAETVYVPALEGGHPQHDLVALAAASVFGLNKLRCYSTYAKLSQYRDVDLAPIGTTEMEWTRPEYERKQEALSCYVSQHRVNPLHFAAVEGRSEWLSGYRRVHLGCGDQVKPGWINIDRQASATSTTPVLLADCATDDWADFIEPHTIDYVFSEDFLEHLPPERKVAVINQCWQVLKPGGVMEHYVPNAGSQNDYGSPSHLSHWNLQTFEHFNVDSYRWAKDRRFEGIVGGFKQVVSELLNWRVEHDGVKRAQSIHVKYRAVAC